MLTKKKSAIIQILDALKSYWFLFPIVGGFVWTIGTLPQKVSATEKNVADLQSRQQKTEEYIDAIEEQKKLIKAAPPGWQWDEVTETYLEWKDDPRLKRKK